MNKGVGVNFFKRKKIQANINLQRLPYTICDDTSNEVAKIKIDAAISFNGFLLIAGWKHGDLEISFSEGEFNLNGSFYKVEREDVLAHFSLPLGSDLGFVFFAKKINSENIKINWVDSSGKVKGEVKLEVEKIKDIKDIKEVDLNLFSEKLIISNDGVFEVSVKKQSSVSEDSLFNNSLGSGNEEKTTDVMLAVQSASVSEEKEGEKEINSLTEAVIDSSCLPNAKAFIEVVSCLRDGSAGLVVGWVMAAPDLKVWLECDENNIFDLNKAYRIFRKDVLDAIWKDVPDANTESGFLLKIDRVKPGELVKVYAEKNGHKVLLAQMTAAEMESDPVKFANWLFGIQTPAEDMAKRFSLLDVPLLENLINLKNKKTEHFVQKIQSVGSVPADPIVSVIIPLYGRLDFVEHQMIEFCEDKWLVEKAEIIYVIDDPALVGSFTNLARELFRIYKVPFKWVFGGVNRGFSAANNLGAKYARAPYLNFLNSDAFPQKQGWLKALVETIQKNKNIGVVSPRLVFADNSIQHAGMEFLRRDELGVWVNHHPHMGLDPALDPSKQLSYMPAVTGACMVMRRKDFDAIGQWDTGYLIGDFEDSDLCLKLRKLGLKSAYLPSVQLTHLERQSFKLIGQGEFRSKVVLFNAVRHQMRWSETISNTVALG